MAKKYEAKTTVNKNSVTAFIRSDPDTARQKDALTLVKIIREESGYPAKMWGPAIIGFGSYHYVYDSGHEGDAPMIGFSPRKGNFALYFDIPRAIRPEILKELGRHKASKYCIYIKKLADIDTAVLKKMVHISIEQTKSKYSC
jgi:hypothetical protein